MTLISTPVLTIADCDAETDFSELDNLIEAARPYGCEFIEFIDDNVKRGYRALEYKVSVIVSHEFDREGCNPVYDTYEVSVKVTPTMPLHIAVSLLIGEINALIED